MASRCGRSWEKAKCVIVQGKEVSCPGMVQTNCSACLHTGSCKGQLLQAYLWKAQQLTALLQPHQVLRNDGSHKFCRVSCLGHSWRSVCSVSAGKHVAAAQNLQSTKTIALQLTIALVTSSSIAIGAI